MRFSNVNGLMHSMLTICGQKAELPKSNTPSRRQHFLFRVYHDRFETKMIVKPIVRILFSIVKIDTHVPLV